jgi:very-short-patch-repair endonuclease
MKLVAQYGSSGYWIDYAVAHPIQPGRFVLAIECDGATYHSSESARDRDRLRQEQLERLGWRFHRIWSSDWYYSKDKAVARVLEAYKDAVESADSGRKPASVRAARPTRPSATDSTSATPARRGTRPRLRTRDSIDDYTPSELVALVRWIESDDLIRTRDELLAETIQVLGFKRRGSRIVQAVEGAIDQARR